jgi:hypothetical protein
MSVWDGRIVRPFLRSLALELASLPAASLIFSLARFEADDSNQSKAYFQQIANNNNY